MIQGSIEDANFAALAESIENAANTSANSIASVLDDRLGSLLVKMDSVMERLEAIVDIIEKNGRYIQDLNDDLKISLTDLTDNSIASLAKITDAINSLKGE